MGLIDKVADKITDLLSKRLDAREEQLNRDFEYNIKELEFYKSNYDREIKGILDQWFDYLQEALLKPVEDSSSPENIEPSMNKNKKNKSATNKNDESRKKEQFVKLKIDTMKYGGTETGIALAVYNQISLQSNNNNNDESIIPEDSMIEKFNVVYATCYLLSTLKEEILGQKIAPCTILQTLLTDYFDNLDLIDKCKRNIEEMKIRLMNDIEDSEITDRKKPK